MTPVMNRLRITDVTCFTKNLLFAAIELNPAVHDVIVTIIFSPPFFMGEMSLATEGAQVFLQLNFFKHHT